MASKTDEIIQLRNEGMAYALKIVEDSGVEELKRQVKLRGLLKVSMRFSPEELNTTIERISNRIFNNIFTLTFAVLHEECKYGAVRLKRFKEQLDKKVMLVGDTDPRGRHYARFEDYAEEANKLYDLGIDIEAIRETQVNNDESGRLAIAADEVFKLLKDNGHHEAVDTVKKFLEQSTKRLTREERKRAEGRMISDKHNQYWMDDTGMDNIEYWFNVFGLAMAKEGSEKEEILNVWKSVDQIIGAINDGTENLDNVIGKLIAEAGVSCEFTRKEKTA